MLHLCSLPLLPEHIRPMKSPWLNLSRLLQGASIPQVCYCIGPDFRWLTDAFLKNTVSQGEKDIPFLVSFKLCNSI